MQQRKGNLVLIQRTQDLTFGKCTRRTSVLARIQKSFQSILPKFSSKNHTNISPILVTF